MFRPATTISPLRVDRGTRLSRKQRAKTWQVFARYRELLNAENHLEWPGAIRETRLFIEKQELTLPYPAIPTSPDRASALTASGPALLEDGADASARGDNYPGTGGK